MSGNGRHFSLIDRLLVVADRVLQLSFCSTLPVDNTNQPNCLFAETEVLTDIERRRSGALMRVNAVGEICAQGLYMGQSVLIHSEDNLFFLWQAADEELQHLQWCHQRLTILHARKSYLEWFCLCGSLLLGMGCSLADDQINLGFLHATEQLVEQHLLRHQERLPKDDIGSRQLLEMMRQDEIRHGENAIRQGGKPLPKWALKWMEIVSAGVLGLCYWI